MKNLSDEAHFQRLATIDERFFVRQNENLEETFDEKIHLFLSWVLI